MEFSVSIIGLFKRIFGAFGQYGQDAGGIGKIPSKTIVLTPRGANRPWWHMGGMSGKPAMQIVADYTVTNISAYNVFLPSVELRVGRFSPKKFLGFVMVKRLEHDVYGSNVIPGGGITDLTLHVWITPPLRKEGEPFVADLAIMDQFANHHWLRNVEFPYR